MSHPVRRCKPCAADWPPASTYNLCPRCLKNTYAGTAEERPDPVTADRERVRYAVIHEFDAKADALAAEARALWDAEMNELLGFNVPPADGQAGLPRPNYGLGGPPRRKPELPSEDEIAGWGTPDA